MYAFVSPSTPLWIGTRKSAGTHTDTHTHIQERTHAQTHSCVCGLCINIRS